MEEKPEFGDDLNICVMKLLPKVSTLPSFVVIAVDLTLVMSSKGYTV